MTRSQLIGKVASCTGMQDVQVEKVLDTIVETIAENLRAGEKVTIAGFGRFEMRQRKTKAYINPKTKQKMRLAPTAIPGFKASGRFKERLEGK